MNPLVHQLLELVFGAAVGVFSVYFILSIALANESSLAEFLTIGRLLELIVLWCAILSVLTFILFISGILFGHAYADILSVSYFLSALWYSRRRRLAFKK